MAAMALSVMWRRHVDRYLRIMQTRIPGRMRYICQLRLNITAYWIFHNADAKSAWAGVCGCVFNDHMLRSTISYTQEHVEDNGAYFAWKRSQFLCSFQCPSLGHEAHPVPRQIRGSFRLSNSNPKNVSNATLPHQLVPILLTGTLTGLCAWR